MHRASLGARSDAKCVPSDVARLRAELGQPSPRRHPVRQHRQRRERAQREGQLVQVDGSHHDSLEGRGPRPTLVAFVDDATGKILRHFSPEENAVGYMQVLGAVSRNHGVPQALCSDRHTIFQSPKTATVEQKLARAQGHGAPAQGAPRGPACRGSPLAQIAHLHKIEVDRPMTF